jgi:hypothetical protein
LANDGHTLANVAKVLDLHKLFSLCPFRREAINVGHLGQVSYGSRTKLPGDARSVEHAHVDPA